MSTTPTPPTPTPTTPATPAGASGSTASPSPIPSSSSSSTPIKPVVAAPMAPRTLPPPIKKTQNPFVYLGIPQAVFDYRPKVPGTKMSIFLISTISLTGAYLYDRRECKKIQQEYINKVKWMSEAPLGTEENVRKLKVYAARVPDDGELERSTKWFKRYMRPILVASGTDYIIKTGTNPGGLGRTLLSEIRARRITDASKDPSIATAKASTTIFTEVSASQSASENVNLVLNVKEEEERKHELEGGIILLGRGALKEYLWALRKGYGETIDLRKEAKLEGLGLGANERRKDGRWEREEELMVRELEEEDNKNPNGGPFDEVKAPLGLDSVNDAAELETTPSTPQPLKSLSYTPYAAIGITQNKTPVSKPSLEPTAEETPLLLPPPSTLPEQPPLLLVPFSFAFGIQRWPAKMYHFFNHRSDVREGGEYALAAIAANTRPFIAPPILPSPDALLDDEVVAALRRGEQHESVIQDATSPTGSPDLDFLFETDEKELSFRRSYRKLPTAHEFAKRSYYKDDLPTRLKTAREIKSGERGFTKAEEKYPPKMESELRKERLDKELRWRRELEGWAIVRSGSGISWDPEKWGIGQGCETPFKVFKLLDDEAKKELERKANEWREEKKRNEEIREEWFKMNPGKSLVDDDE